MMCTQRLNMKVEAKANIFSGLARPILTNLRRTVRYIEVEYAESKDQVNILIRIKGTVGLT